MKKTNEHEKETNRQWIGNKLEMKRNELKWTGMNRQWTRNKDRNEEEMNKKWIGNEQDHQDNTASGIEIDQNVSFKEIKT